LIKIIIVKKETICKKVCYCLWVGTFGTESVTVYKALDAKLQTERSILYKKTRKKVEKQEEID